jgi:hypothetical protein
VRGAGCQWRQISNVRLGSPIHRRASNFDIYLPNWLASRNKTIFGTLFVVNELIVPWCWLKRARLSSANNGFVLGAIRALWVVPHVGTRTAELMEIPIMLVVTIVAARWTVLHLSAPMFWSSRLEMGCIALARQVFETAAQ